MMVMTTEEKEKRGEVCNFLKFMMKRNKGGMTVGHIPSVE